MDAIDGLNHPIERWWFADGTDPRWNSGYFSQDVGKIAYEADNKTYWRLDSLSAAGVPTWVSVTKIPSGGANGGLLVKNSGNNWDTRWSGIGDGGTIQGYVFNAQGFQINSAWLGVQHLDDVAWVNYMPTFTPSSGAFGSIVPNGRYKKIGKTVLVMFSLQIPAVGTAAGQLNISLPVQQAASGFSGWGCGREGAVNGGIFSVTVSGQSAMAVMYNNSFPGGNGWNLTGGFTYEAA